MGLVKELEEEGKIELDRINFDGVCQSDSLHLF
jgi:hypothetical protein